MNCHHKLFLACLAGVIVLTPGYIGAQTPAKATQNKAQATQQQQDQQEEYTEEEYDAYEKATKEPDLDKRAKMLAEFMDKYPQSKLQPYIVTAQQTLMFEYQKDQKWAKLEPLAEQWLKYRPNDLQTMQYVAEAAHNQGHDQKYIDYGLKIFAVKPTGGIAYYIAQSYKKVGDDAKYLEWTQKLFTYPEFDGDFGLRFVFVQKYIDQKKYDKAAEYAQLAIKSLDAAKRPDSVSEAKWREDSNAVRRVCNYIIGVNYYEKEQWKEAIAALIKALKVEKFDAGFYYIGLSQWKQNEVEAAMLSFAKAELLKGEMRTQAKEKLETLYKGLHNNTTIGIEKVYRRAETELNERSAAN